MLPEHGTARPVGPAGSAVAVGIVCVLKRAAGRPVVDVVVHLVAVRLLVTGFGSMVAGEGV